MVQIMSGVKQTGVALRYELELVNVNVLDTIRSYKIRPL